MWREKYGIMWMWMWNKVYENVGKCEMNNVKMKIWRKKKQSDVK